MLERTTVFQCVSICENCNNACDISPVCSALWQWMLRTIGPIIEQFPLTMLPTPRQYVCGGLGSVISFYPQYFCYTAFTSTHISLMEKLRRREVSCPRFHREQGESGPQMQAQKILNPASCTTEDDIPVCKSISSNSAFIKDISRPRAS